MKPKWYWDNDDKNLLYRLYFLVRKQIKTLIKTAESMAYAMYISEIIYRFVSQFVADIFCVYKCHHCNYSIR